MTASTTTRVAIVGQIAERVSDLIRTAAKARAQRQREAGDDIEWAAHTLLRSLPAHEPMRVSELADIVGADISTVSRQVAALVKEGLLYRQADPNDGRVSLLRPTDAGAVIVARHRAARTEFFEHTLAHWSDEDLDRFADYLDRFRDDYRIAHHNWLAQKNDEPGRRNAAQKGPTA